MGGGERVGGWGIGLGRKGMQSSSLAVCQNSCLFSRTRLGRENKKED